MTTEEKLHYCKDTQEFAEMVMNHAHRSPQTMADLLVTGLVDGTLHCGINMEVYNKGRVNKRRVFATMSTEETLEAIKNSDLEPIIGG